MLRDRQAWLHSSKSFLAAMLALYIALTLDLPRPFWAMTTAYMVMQPILGGTQARGFYRVAGTVLGSVAVVLILPLLIQTPLLLCAALSLWLSACLCVTLLHRGPASYVSMLAGYTAAFVGFPLVQQPEAVFQTAVLRIEEILVGSLCAVLVSAIVFPASMRPALRRRIGALMGDARAWCAAVLSARGSPDELRRRLAGDVAALDAVIPFARRDDVRQSSLAGELAELRALMLGMLPVMASIEDRLHNLGAAAQDPALLGLIGDLRTWIESDAPPSRETLEAFRERIAGLRPQLDGSPACLLRDSLLLRLKELAELWHDNRHLQGSIQDGTQRPARAFGIDLTRLARLTNRHIDWALLLFRALAAGFTLFAYCLVWIGTGWTGGAPGAMMAAVTAAFFVSHDDPVPGMMVFFLSALATTAVVGAYLFGVFPAIHDLVPLVLVIAPPFLLFGLMTTRPRFFLPTLILISYFPTQLAIQNHQAADFTAFVNGSVASLLGMLFTLVVTQLFRSVGAQWSARRLIRQGWKLLAAAAEGRGQQDRDRFMVRMLDLLGLLAPRLVALHAAGEDAMGVDMLREARIGLNILMLRGTRSRLPAVSQAHLTELLEAVAGHYRARERAGEPLPPPQALRETLDASLSRLALLPAGTARDEALLGLVGLRFGLFPREAATGGSCSPVGGRMGGSAPAVASPG